MPIHVWIALGLGAFFSLLICADRLGVWTREPEVSLTVRSTAFPPGRVVEPRNHKLASVDCIPPGKSLSCGNIQSVLLEANQ